jgi:hypothetical protein
VVSAQLSSGPVALRGGLLAMAPGWIVAAIWAALILRDGGYFMLDWAPVALVLIALLAGVAAGRGHLLPAAGPTRTALLVFAAIVVWCGASVAWADAQAAAWEAADQMLLYLLMGWILVLLPWTPARALALLVGWSVAVAVACLAGYVDALAASDLGARFPEFRWAGPMGYANATGAIGAMALPGMLVLASRRGMAAWAQAAAMGVATFLVAFALLPQTRAALLGMPIVIVVLLAAGPDRGRLLRRVILLGLAVLAALDPIIAIDTAAQAHGPVRPAWDAAAWRILLSVAGAVLAMLALHAAERRIRLPAPVVRRLRLAGFAAAGLLAVVVVGAAVASADRIADGATSVWNDVRGGAPVRRVDGPRLLSVAPYQRSDYWRVAVNGLRSAPVGGLGADGFEALYARERDYPKHSRYTHMIWLRIGAETGIVGLLLTAALLLAAARALRRRRRAAGPEERRVVAIALALAAYMAFAASLDWLEEFPALAGPAIGAVAIALALASPQRGLQARRPRVLATVAAAAVGVAAVVAIVLPWLSLREMRTARALADTDAPAAIAALDRASSLNPLDPLPASLTGFIHLQDGRPAAASAAFRRSLRIEDGWLGHFELALIAASQGDTAGARRELAATRRLDREEEIVDRFAEMLATGEPVDPVAVNRRAQQDPLYVERPAT